MLTSFVKILVLTIVGGVMLANLTPLGAQGTQESACTPPRETAITGSAKRTIRSGDLERSYLLYVPQSYDPSQKLPLVLSLHGFTGTSEQQAELSGWSALAEKGNFIVAYPQGASFPARWNSGNRGFGEYKVDDVQFIRELLTDVTRTLCVDSARIYVNGYSAGAGMSSRLGCELSDRIAAIGGVAGAYNDNPGGCNMTRPVPVIAFHGKLDPVSPYTGNKDMQLTPIGEWVAEWAARNGCDGNPETFFKQGNVTGIRYGNCTGNAEAILYTVSDGGHTWPGGKPGAEFIVGKTSMEINASQLMWEFFKAHPLTISK